MEQQRTAGLAERQIAQFIENHEVGIHQPMRDLSLFAGRLLQSQRIDELYSGEEAYSLAMPADCLNTQGGGQMRLAGVGPPMKTKLCAASRNDSVCRSRIRLSSTFNSAKSNHCKSRWAGKRAAVI
jgi:hypothetical protein